MQRRIKFLVGILVVFFCILLGCERKKEQEESLLILSAETTAEAFEDTVKADAVESKTDATESKTDATESKTDAVEGKVDIEAPSTCVIHICGAVQAPGVYTFPTGSRIFEAVEAAGGFTEAANQDYLNQADVMTDGMKIYVPTEAEIEETGIKSISLDEKDEGLVNINRADEALLCTLPGIGASKANSIITYRQTNGDYRKIEDIMCVEGIKEGLFHKIKDKITV